MRLILENINREPIAEIVYSSPTCYLLVWLNKGTHKITHPHSFGNQKSAISWANYNNTFNERNLIERAIWDD